MKRFPPYSQARAAWRRWRWKRSGMRPWAKGYTEYKEHQIASVLADGRFQPEALPGGYGFRLDERIVEYPWLFSRLPAGPGTLLDAGSVLNFYFLLELPALQSKRLHICTLAPELNCFWKRGVSYLFGDLRQLPYRDDWFDWVVCVSTLEHVGLDNSIYTDGQACRETRPQDYRAAVLEMKRVLKPGGVLYLTVPFGKAVNHGWLQIFDPPMVESVIEDFRPSALDAIYFLYRADGWHNSTSSEAATATFFNIHRAPNYDPDFAASARAVCCLELRN